MRSYTRPTMELAVVAARSPSGSLLAGKYGVGMLSIGGTSPAAMERHTENWGLYEETARANGHVLDRKDWRVVGMFHIAGTREQRVNVQFGVQAFANYFRDVATFPIIPPDVPDPTDWLIESGTGCIGTPDDAIAYVDRLMTGSGGLGVLCELAQNWADWDATKKTAELMARFVHPHLLYQQSRELLRGSYDFATSRHRRLHRQGECGDPEGDRPPRRTARRHPGATPPSKPLTADPIPHSPDKAKTVRGCRPDEALSECENFHTGLRVSERYCRGGNGGAVCLGNGASYPEMPD